MNLTKMARRLASNRKREAKQRKIANEVKQMADLWEKKYMHLYLNEISYRYNQRNQEKP